MKLTVIGSGDAFGSGGRLQTCFHVSAAGHTFLIDCGVTALIGMHRLGLDPNAVQTVILSHLHGDHFGGLVWWMLHGQHVAKRTAPLIVVGPETVQSRFIAAAEALFPGSTKIKSRFEMRFIEYRKEQATPVADLSVTPFEVRHPSGAMSSALRISIDGKIVSYTGDTEWVESLVHAGKDADLYIMECFAFEGPTSFHLDWKTIEANLPRITPKRVMLTHMGAGMLARRNEAAATGAILADDGFTIII